MDNTYFAQNITIQNTRLSSISQLRVSEHVPVSISDKVNVNLLEPNVLVPDSRRKNMQVQDKVRARWVRLNGDTQDDSEDEVDAENAQGLFEWVCEIEAGKSVDLTLAWEVVTPIGTEWNINSQWSSMVWPKVS